MNDENTKKELGLELKRLRERKFPGESLRRVATEHVEIEYTHLFRIESGQYTPSDEKLTTLLDTYDATAEEKLFVFNLARLTPAHHDAYAEAVKELSPDRVHEVMFRRQKPPEDNDHAKT